MADRRRQSDRNQPTRMTSEREVALNLVMRLLAGEQGNLPMHLALLLEKSSLLQNSEEHYRKILPPELGHLGFRESSAHKVAVTSWAVCVGTPPRVAATTAPAVSSRTNTTSANLADRSRGAQSQLAPHAQSRAWPRPADLRTPRSLDTCDRMESASKVTGNIVVAPAPHPGYKP
jgi:hypothetical protein